MARTLYRDSNRGDLDRRTARDDTAVMELLYCISSSEIIGEMKAIYTGNMATGIGKNAGQCLSARIHRGSRIRKTDLPLWKSSGSTLPYCTVLGRGTGIYLRYASLTISRPDLGAIKQEVVGTG